MDARGRSNFRSDPPARQVTVAGAYVLAVKHAPTPRPALLPQDGKTAPITSMNITNRDVTEGLLSLLPQGAPRTFDRGQPIYRPEDPADSLLLVADGAVRIGHLGYDGRETILDFEAAESFFGLAGLSGQPMRGETADALGPVPVTVLEWSTDDLGIQMARTPSLAQALIGVLAQKLAESKRHIEILTNDDVSRRLVKALLRLGERFGGLRIRREWFA